jgi:hypothetical protein
VKSLEKSFLAIGVAASFVMSAPAGATVLSFDDLSSATAPFVSNYGGFTVPNLLSSTAPGSPVSTR